MTHDKESIIFKKARYEKVLQECKEFRKTNFMRKIFFEIKK